MHIRKLSSWFTLLLQLNEKGIPKDFLLGDIHVDKQRHLLFATPRQIELLKKAKVWFVDGTFKVAKDPFKQLLSVHAFIRKNKCTKQVPLAFVVMSGKRRKDYEAVSCFTIGIH